MRTHHFLIGATVVVILGVAGGFLAMIYDNRPAFARHTATAPTEVRARPALGQPVFSPPAPEEAPAEWRGVVLRGQRILMNTKTEAASFVGKTNQLACRSCHFQAGRSRDSISLVGVAAKYPWAPPGGQPVSLAQKVQNCFVTELNGTVPPEDSGELQAILAYLQWISKGVPVQSQPEWLSRAPLDLQRPADVSNGMQRFSDVCTRCHGSEGQGNAIASPLWGSGSFTQSASMGEQTTLAAFIHRFMPLGHPDLPKAVAFDIAGFVRSRPRPPGGKPVAPLAAAP